MMEKKYLVYISSTADDLKNERRELIRAVTELGAVPVTMEGFDYNDEESQGFIRKAIFDSDYFINLTAYKCGQAIGKSFSLEFEFLCAEKYRIPVFSFIIDEKARWKASKKEKSAPAAKALVNFKKKLCEGPNARWTTTADLCHKAYVHLIREMSLKPRQGWVRGSEAVTPAAVNEMARLIRENDELRSKVRVEDAELVSQIRNRMKHCLKTLATHRISLSFWYTPGENWENTKAFRYLRLFKLLVPELTTPKSTSELTRFLGNILNPDLEKTVRKDNPTPTNTIKKIMADFCILKLAKVMDLKPGASGDDEAWEITEFGREVFAVYRLRQLNKAVINAETRKAAATEV